jgi:probable dihydroxyacetone kinase regulator
MSTSRETKTEEKIIKSFKKLVNEDSFDKVTVTMIAEDAGISRPIFYRYFKDKYELMDYMLYTEVTSQIETLMEHDMILEAIKYLFSHIMNEQKLYRKLFETTGQNSFEQVMVDQFTNFFSEHLRVFDTDSIPDNPMLTPLIICKYVVLGLTISIKAYLNSDITITVDQAVEAYYFMVSHTLFDLTREDFRPKLMQDRAYFTLDAPHK